MTANITFIFHRVMKNFSKISKLKFSYYKKYNKWPNLKNPNTFNEKILHRMLYDKNPLYSELSDKISVREYIKKTVGSEVLIPLIYTTNQPNDLLNINDWSNTVIKPNHAAGLVKIYHCNPNKDKKIEDIKDFHDWLKIDYSKQHHEWHYSLIQPKLLIEKNISINQKTPRDYKFHCFKQKNGEINYILQLVDGRFNIESRGYYLNSLDNCIAFSGEGNHHLTSEEKINLQKAIDFNYCILSENFKYLRVDWYLIENKLYFGELTFTSGAGLSNEFGNDLEKIMSDWWV